MKHFFGAQLCVFRSADVGKPFNSLPRPHPPSHMGTLTAGFLAERITLVFQSLILAPITRNRISKHVASSSGCQRNPDDIESRQLWV